MTAQEILRSALNNKEEIISNRHYLHKHPETGFDLTDTLSFVKQELENMGYQPQLCGKSGLVAIAGNKKRGKTFLLRADMDALPIREDADVEFASTNGKMHACGHDMHTAMLLESARILKAHENEINGTVKLTFQPAEEILEGSMDMLKSGILKNPDVDAGFMIHVMTGMPFPNGSAIVCDGGVSAPAADYFHITIQGKGCHGSMPWQGIDPINIAAHVIIALQELHARELSMGDPSVLTIGSLHGGNAANAIADSVVLDGTLRAYDEAVRNRIKTRMTEIVTHTAAAFRGNAAVEFGSGCPTLLNDPALSESTIKYIRELNGEHMAFKAGELATQARKKEADSSQPKGASSNGCASESSPSQSGGSEDFAYISHEIPTIMVALAAGHPDAGFCYPLHHPKVQFDDDVLPIGAAIYAYVAMRWLEEH